MPGEANCIFTKRLIPFVEKEVGAEDLAAICHITGRSRAYLRSDQNWLPLGVAGEMVKACQQLMHEPNEERWARRYGESFMDWKPREERSYLGTYSMGIGNPRAAYQRVEIISSQQSRGFVKLDIVRVGRRRARFRWVPLPGPTIPVWSCTGRRVRCAALPTNGGLPRPGVRERTGAARGAAACRWDVQWKNPSRGPLFWTPSLIGGAGAAVLAVVDVATGAGWPLLTAVPL